MATITQNITIDVARANVFDAVIGKQYDEDSRFLKCSITQEGEPLTIPSGSSIAINAKRPDGTMGSFAGTRGADGTAIVPISSWILEQNGMVNLSVSIVGSGGEKLTSCTFYLNVQEAEGEGYILVFTAPSSVATGTYYITLGGVSYQFDLTTALVTGDKIYFSSTYATGKTVDGSDGSTIETFTLTEGTSGTELVGSDVINFLASFMGQIAELGNKADKVGESPNLVAGTAEQIIGEEFTENKVPYSFRQTPGSGKRLAEEVVGATAGWNQLVQDGNFPDDTKWIATGTGAVFTVANNKATMHRDSATSVTINLAFGTSYRPQSVSGHKYLFAATIEAASGQINYIPTGSTTDGMMGYITLAAKTRVGYIWPCSVDKPIQGTVRGYTGLGVTSAIDYTVEDYICVDLTAALGSTIADYLYALESNTPGAGVAKFRELYRKDYYAHCEPTLQSVCVSEHREYGVNAWDEVWENGGYDTTNGTKTASSNRIRCKNYIPCLPNTTYYVKRTAPFQLYYYDQNKAYLSYYGLSTDNTFTTPANCGFITFQTGSSTTPVNEYNHDICINISNPLINGHYYPYSVHSYPMEAVELRGVLRLDSNNNIYADGDIYRASGIERHIAQFTFTGNESWTRLTADSPTWWTAAPSNASHDSGQTTVSTDFEAMPNGVGGAHTGDGQMWFQSAYAYPRLYVCNSAATSASDIRAFTAGKTLWYLMTPENFIYESAAPYPSLQHCSGGGTEEYVDYLVGQGTRDVSIPAGHNSKYYPNLTQRISDIPEPPSGDGTYTLKCTVSSGVRTFAWV